MDPLLLLNALNKILEVNLVKDEANKLFKKMQDETSVTSLSILNTHSLSELELSCLFGVFDKLKELNVYANDPSTNLPRQDVISDGHSL